MAAWWGVEYPAGGIFPMENRECRGGVDEGPRSMVNSMAMPRKSKSTKGKTPIYFSAEFVVVACIFA